MSGDFLSWLETQGGETVRRPAGATLFHRDAPVAHLYRVLDGEARLVRHAADGRLAVLQRAGAGALLAEASLYAPSYHCDGVVSRSATLRRYPATALRAALADHPGAAEALARHLAREVQRARLRAEILSLRRVADRLDAWLAWSDGALPPRGGWRALAEEIGVAPEALYREIAARR